MSLKPRIIACLAITLASVNAAGWAQDPREGKVVFLKGETLLTANASGAEARVLIKDAVRKASPQWSPNKERIVYRVDGDKTKDPKSYASLIVIGSDGKLLKNAPVLATESDGTIVGGMRFVEESGWHSNAAIFASGSVNPWKAEYRIIDVETGNVIESYFGTGFATCASRAKVAYASETRSASGNRKSHVEVDGTPVYAGAGDGDSLIGNLEWSTPACERLAFVEASEASASFVVLRGDTVEAKIALRGGMRRSIAITHAEDSFLLHSDSGVVLYDTTTRSLRPAPEIVEKVNRVKMERESVLKSLGGRSANWSKSIN